MYLRHLKLSNFKNIEEREFDFSQINCFVGNNGVGKTNILDAIYYLSFCKSFFNHNDNYSIRNGSDFFAIHGDYSINGVEEKISCTLKAQGKKQIKHSGKAYTKHSEHIGKIPAVMIAPTSHSLITGASEVRRKFIDIIISQQDKVYLQSLIRYNKAVEQRNKVLKNYQIFRTFDEIGMQIWEEQIARFGDEIREKRKLFFEQIEQPLMDFYSYISQNKEDIRVEYITYEGDLLTLLRENRESEKAIGYTKTGIHKDDLAFYLKQMPIRSHASQGQQKTFLLALKLAQFDYLQKNLGVKPILLLDDIFDKFDFERVSRILTLLEDRGFGQVFITDTHLERVEKIIGEGLKEKTKIFKL
jgi:DNA replication and repair protein RecF